MRSYLHTKTVLPALVGSLLSQGLLGQTQPASAPEVAAPPTEAATDSATGGDQANGNGAAGDDDPLRIFRAPLLREGSSLVEAVARLKRDHDQNWWMLEVQPVDSTLPPYALVVLPCTRLTEMQRIRETMQGDVAFEVTGRLYVFRDRNYILPSHAAVVSGASATEPAHGASVTQSAGDGADDQGEAGPTTAGVATQPSTTAPSIPAKSGDSAESIMRELEVQSGPIARSSGTATASAPSSARHTVAAPIAARATNIQENTAVINRRGKITRDRSGGWLLVFDADAAGLSDPPLKLLPCMLLESIEDYARRVGNNSPIIVTGQVYLYNGQNYLLPTVYRIPRESTRITP